MTQSSEDREKTAGICNNCGELFTVWADQDGAIRPVSPHNACPCDDPSPRVVDEDEVFGDAEREPGNE